MATGHVLPSLLQSEITSWLKLDESLPSMTSSISSSFPSSNANVYSSVDTSEALDLPPSSSLVSSVPSAGFPSAKSFPLSQLSSKNKPSATSTTAPQSNSSNLSGFSSTSSLFNSSLVIPPVQTSPTGQYQSHSFTSNQYNFPTFPGPTFTSFSSYNPFSQQFPYSTNIVTATPVNPGGSPLHSSSSSNSTPNSPTGSPRGYSSPVHPSQVSSSSSSSSFPVMSEVGGPHFVNLFAQFQQYVKQQHHHEEEDKKKKESSKLPIRRVRQPRPKVVEAKGAVQCQGKNRKKGTQCRNAALMEYIGPRPVYCAEHIELDPRSLYEKCKSPYQKEPGDNKGCKEVVLKEFGMCYKHFPDFCSQLIQARDAVRARKHYERVIALLAQLEKEAASAKKKDGDLYQRKNKLIPKFQEMKRVMARTVESLEGPGSLDSPINSHVHKDVDENGIQLLSGSESDVSNSSPINGFHQEESESEHSHNGWFIHDSNQDISPKILQLSDEDIADAFADFSDE